MSTFKVVRDAFGFVKGCGPNTESYQPTVSPGGTLTLSDTFLDVEFSPAEQDATDTACVANTFEGDKIRRLVFLIEFDQENRIRVLEGKPQITAAQYRDALIARYKALT